MNGYQSKRAETCWKLLQATFRFQFTSPVSQFNLAGFFRRLLVVTFRCQEDLYTLLFIKRDSICRLDNCMVIIIVTMHKGSISK